MAKFLQSLKYIITGKEELGDTALKENTRDITTEFLLFIKQQAKRIKEHIEYENDLSENLPRDSKLIIKFDIDSYISEFDSFFQSKQLYSLSQEELFNLTLNILVPPDTSQPGLSKEFRKKIYAGMLKNICLYKSIPVQGLTKAYYDKIAKLDSFNNTDGNTVLELYKDSVEILGKVVDQIDPAVTEEPSFELDTNAFLNQVIRSFSIRDRKDLENLLYGNRFWGVVFSTFLLVIIGALFLVFHNNILALIMESDPAALSVTIYTACVIGLFVFFIMVRISSYSKARIRRKFFLTTINTLISELKINYGEVKNLFREQFKFDIRKTRKIKRLEKKTEVQS